MVEFDHFRKEAGLPTFTMSVSNWIEKTGAKEALFNHILELIKDANNDPDFDIALTTNASGPKDFWITPYRHWLFLPAEFKDKK